MKSRCSISCPPRMADGSMMRPSLLNTCLLCWGTGWRIPINGKVTIDEWIGAHLGLCLVRAVDALGKGER